MRRKAVAQHYTGKKFEFCERNEWNEKGPKVKENKRRSRLIGRECLKRKWKTYTMGNRRDHLRK